MGLGFIGFGLIGKRHVLDFRDQAGAWIVAIAEVHSGRRDEAVALAGNSAASYADFRQLLDDHDVDAVVVSTPDHWHALMTMMACAAGKDVYVEKPLTLFPREGRWMVDVARRHNRVVQVGTQQRSGRITRKRASWFAAVGSVRSWRCGCGTTETSCPASARLPTATRRRGWITTCGSGPRPKRPYNSNRSLYHFRWFWDYSGGQMTNLGQHSLDIVHWFLDATAPTAVTSAGGRFALKDNGETPDTQDALFEYPRMDRHVVAAGVQPRRGPAIGLEFCGTQGKPEDLAQGLPD